LTAELLDDNIGSLHRSSLPGYKDAMRSANGFLGSKKRILRSGDCGGQDAPEMDLVRGRSILAAVVGYGLTIKSRNREMAITAA
jgi:hypothetical protein